MKSLSTGSLSFLEKGMRKIVNFSHNLITLTVFKVELRELEGGCSKILSFHKRAKTQLEYLQEKIEKAKVEKLFLQQQRDVFNINKKKIISFFSGQTTGCEKQKKTY